MLMDQYPLNQYGLQEPKPSFTKQNLTSRLKKISSKLAQQILELESFVGDGHDECYVSIAGIESSFSPVEFDGTDPLLNTCT